MGRASRTGTEGIAITAIVVAVTFIIEGEPLVAGVAAVIGGVALLVHDHLELKEISVSEEQIRRISQESADSIEDVTGDVRDRASDD